MAQVRSWVSTHKIGAATVVLVALIAALAAAIGVAQATDRSAFCGSACHEMGPFHSAWSQGQHKDIACVECHVAPGTVSRLTHKAEAMRELWVHIAGDPKFPLPSSAEVPNGRCLRCHQTIKTTQGFDHAKHAEGRTCVQCHADAGHRVTQTALGAAGVLSTATPASAVTSEGAIAVPDAGSANIPGHVTVSCSRCHDLAKTGCKRCHAPKHENTGAAVKTAQCQTCHAAGATFAFTHPQNAPECGSCHKPPAEKHDFTGECTDCHARAGTLWTFDHNNRANCQNCHNAPPKHRAGECSKCHNAGKSWTFKHPGSSADCTSCHTRPAGHRAGACTTCHNTGASWAFRHPSGQSCTNCHTRPAGHRSGSCTSCHRAGVSWKFRHPGSSAKCTNCHNRPAGHRSGSCSSCHRTGVSWSFRHSSNLKCSSCHNPPSGHYGSTCASCHSPSRSWSSATIDHPRIRGGEHTYKSFACTNCHPNGYSSATCVKCHSSASGPDDD